MARSDSGPPHEHRNRAVPLLISAQAALHPQDIALAQEDERITYAELELRANQLANYLKAKGVGREDLIALCLERSPEFVVAALAILKCGAAYLPMDLVHPSERLRYMISDGGARLLLTRTKFVERWAGGPVEILALDAESEAIRTQSSDAPLAQPGADDLAYVIYTSGSTGKPKGVEILHRSLSNLVSWHVETFRLDSSSRTTFQASVGFDAAVWEIWPTLTAGAALYVPDETTRLVPEQLRDWLVQKEITVSFVPTAVAEQLITLPWPRQTALRFLLTGADTLHRYPLPGLPFALVNNYGPTECTVVATSGVVLAGENTGSPPSIGLPIFHVQVHILDEDGCEVPDGLTGELYVGGAGLARGYRNRMDLTRERFMTGHCVSDPGRLYRTGDLACRLPNGEIAFVGRIDDQIKIRGYRIEPAEINAVLKEHPLVKVSVVIAREDQPGDKKLVAYVVPVAESKKNEQDLREAIRRSLPDYMEPAAFVWMDSIPLTTNGKVNRAALPVPRIEARANDLEFVAPRTQLEEALARIIAKVLKLPRVGIHDDFFHLGAHSLLGAQIVAQVRNAFGAELKLLDVFDSPTVAMLAQRIEDTLVTQLNAMSEADVDAALAAFDRTAGGPATGDGRI